MFPLLSTSNLLDTLLPGSLKTQNPEHVQTDSHFHSGNFFVLLLSSSPPSLLNRQCMAPVCNNGLQLCLQTNLVRIRHSWFRRRCQRPQLTYNGAIRPAHCSQSHFVPALVPLSEDRSQRIKASWLSLVETRRVEGYRAWELVFSFLFCGKCLLLMLFS